MGGVENRAFGLGFQHLTRDVANVNALKTMFKPYIVSKGMQEKDSIMGVRCKLKIIRSLG